MPFEPSTRGVPSWSAGVPFAQEDLARAFDAKTLQRGRALILKGAVALAPTLGRIEATVSDFGQDLKVTVTPVQQRRLYLERSCSCGRASCAHMAAAAMHALETRPEWRRPVQASLLDLIAETPPANPVRPVSLTPAHSAPAYLARWTLEPGRDDIALFVTAALVPANGAAADDGLTAVTPRQVVEKVARDARGDADRTVARLLGAGGVVRTPVPKSPADVVDRVLRSLAKTGRLHWHTGASLAEGPARIIRAFRDPETRKVRPTGLPKGGALVKGTGYWCVDPGAGRISPAKLQVVDAPKPRIVASAPATTPAAANRAQNHARTSPQRAPSAPGSNGAAATIIDRTPTIVARLGRVLTPDGLVDTLRLVYDYGEPGHPAEIEPEDQRQFARAVGADGVALFIRRDKGTERAALDKLLQLGFTQLRIESPTDFSGARGSRVHRLTGRDGEARWSDFMATHAPALEAAGWALKPDADFSTRIVEADADAAVAVRDAGDGWFDLDVGVEIDGERRPLLPILARLLGRGGMEAAKVTGGRAQIVLNDGSILALPADRVARLLSVLEAMLDSGGRAIADTLRVPLHEADALLDIDDLIAKRPDASARIDRFLRRFRETETLPEIAVPAGFRGELRDYQHTGLAWLQNLRAQDMAGILADDMGLGKTAQTLAHVAVEHEAGRLVDPCLVVVPTSLVPNWVSEAARFVPHLRVLVLHGLDRHERRDEIEAAQIVVTTYGVISRDVDLMKAYEWHLLVLDEAQAIKNPDAKATRAVCSLRARHRLCLSGTPIENNLGELWSQFAFLMPGLLGDRKSFQKRFRTPIEKRGDATRAAMLWRRIRPFLLRRSKNEVAKELPPKTEVIRRIELGPAQRDLYETIRLSVHERVRAAIEASGLSRNAITVIDALLKLRQACCDPRLVKIQAAAEVAESAKLESLVEMVREMVPEGRRLLIFSQFTSMLDLVKPELKAAGIDYVELTGQTADRAAPVERFQRGEVPVFLISLKAGGRGLNLTAADVVIHYDPWWNPAAEDQATDRAHRIGQDKPVFVYKLIAADTVEERILELQRRKGRLTAATIDGKGLAGALEGDDIDFLFGGPGDA